MSRSQSKPDLFPSLNMLISRVSRLERIASAVVLKDMNTAGLSSAQIDATVFGSSSEAQPTDGLIITDKTNALLLVRESNKWRKTAALTTIP